MCENVQCSKRQFRAPTAMLREQLLSVHGIGPETADAILLYAGNHPVFVVDAYARRILERHQLAEPHHGDEYLRQFFENNLPADPALYNEFHALIVRHAKVSCAKRPSCPSCVLLDLCPAGSGAARDANDGPEGANP